MENFTPLLSALGGVLIGLAAVLLLLWQGRIAGISGILGSLWTRQGRAGASFRLPFLLGLVLTGVLLAQLHPAGFAVEVSRSPAALIAAGLLVGFGTQLGSGCTSGHGVCGLGRLSSRSLAATLTFMASGAITAAVVTHLLGGTL
ncbi:MAG: YeeE/YedE family protein [Rickettsiales bacterium]|nr:YeeE/YedE family protein [Rickettsiales bacterium]|tara:strand:+ start:1157 stop:1591 length:435 start_codon:yes stop_codon:yes gene_type:complete